MSAELTDLIKAQAAAVTEAYSMSTTRLLLNALADAESEVAEVRQLRIEVTKLRQLLVVKLCDCRRMASTLPLQPLLHGLHCGYRRAMR